MYGKELDKSALVPGDVVGVPQYVNIGWTRFRYVRITPKTIKRITPARTKFVMDDGVAYGQHAMFYPVTPESEYRNKIIDCAENINRILFELSILKQNGGILTKDDDTLVRLSDALDGVMKALRVVSETPANKEGCCE